MSEICEVAYQNSILDNIGLVISLHHTNIPKAVRHRKTDILINYRPIVGLLGTCRPYNVIQMRRMALERRCGFEAFSLTHHI